jgi:adenylate kinase family enzyme
MPETVHCPDCGAELPPGLPRGLCARCALRGALELSDGETKVLLLDTQGAVAGDRIGRYKLLEKIGESGCGVVSMAELRLARMHEKNSQLAAADSCQTRAVRILVFGNSGSGKSTLARQLANQRGLTVLDLDQVIWSRTDFAKFRPDEEIIRELDAFVAVNPGWVVEGCYGRWMEYLQTHCTEMVFLNTGEAACLANCRARPWEPEKYPSKAEQDAKLPFLLDWVRGYYTRTDDMSLATHRRIFDSFAGTKKEIGATETLAVSPALSGNDLPT